MTAAYELWTRHHIASDVFEARDRVGGRTWSVSGPAGTVDLGGHFISTTDRALRSLIKELGLTETRLPPRDDARYLLHGDDGNWELLESASIPRRFAATLRRVKQDQDRLGIQDFKTPKPITSELRAADALSIRAYLDSIRAPSNFAEWVQAYYGADYGRRLDELSALHLLSELDIDLAKQRVKFFDEDHADEALAVEGGNQRVTLELARQLGNVHLNHVLTDITGAKNGQLRLNFRTPAGNELVDTDYAIVTVPFSVLKDKIKINIPDFPERVARVIRSTVQGRNSKMILSFRSPFWAKRYRQSGSLIAADFETWPDDTSRGDGEGSLTVYFHVEQDFSQPERLKDQILSMLEKAFPGISKEYVSLRVVDWPRDPFSRGSFSGAKTPGQYLAGWPSVAEMRVGHLIFAGEHLAGNNLALVGYMNGAVESGIAASRLAASLIRPSKP